MDGALRIFNTASAAEYIVAHKVRLGEVIFVSSVKCPVGPCFSSFHYPINNLLLQYATAGMVNSAIMILNSALELLFIRSQGFKIKHYSFIRQNDALKGKSFS